MDKIGDGSNDEEIIGLANDADARLRVYTLLPGILWRFAHLYKKLPSEDSWVYQLPDGAFWRQAVQKFGIAAVDIVTAPDFDRLSAAFGIIR